ncbi:MAG: HNH endonuclease, partial [Clostridiales bacterium]|nr:HNH endonuclease [Clostridiales bacterium]
MVYVLNKEGIPIMPTARHGRVRRLLERGQAKVVRRTPFTIQLAYDTEDITQPVTLGIDAGSKTVGVSTTTETKELYAAECKLRADVTKNLSARREFRRARRNRKTRYRAPRFNNRIRAKHKGWLAPSIEQKINTHIQLIKTVCNLLPITKIIIETAEFDTQRLKAMLEGKPLPVGADYQLGEQYDEYNTRQYIFHRDGYRCRVCGSKHGDTQNGVKVKFHVHHLESRKTGGNAPNNLITLCRRCHTKYHEGKLLLPETLRKPYSMRDATFMGITRKTLMGRVRRLFPGIEVMETHGYITKCRRETARLQKSHAVDARCITDSPMAKPLDCIYQQKAVRRHNRQLHKATILKGGIRKANQTPKYVHGFQLFD